MVNVEECRKLLDDSSISDDEVEQIRNEYRALAEIIFQSWLENKQKNKPVQ